MKKTFKIFFPLLVIFGVLFAMLVPVSADDTPVYNDEYYNLYSDNSPFSFYGSDEYFVKDQTSIRSIGDCSGMSCLFMPGEGFSLACQNKFQVHISFSSNMPFIIGVLKQDTNGDIWFYRLFSYSANSEVFSSCSTSDSVSSSTVTFTFQVSGSMVDFCFTDNLSSSSTNFTRGTKELYGNFAETFDTRPCFVFSPLESGQVFEFNDFSFFSLSSFSVGRANYLLPRAFLSGSVSGYSSGYADGESVGYSSGRTYGESVGYQMGVAAGEALHANDYANGQARGEALHANDYENGYNAGIIADTNVVTDTVDGVFDGLLSTLGVLNGFSIFGITLGGILSIAAIFLVLFFIFKVIRK